MEVLVKVSPDDATKDQLNRIEALLILHQQRIDKMALDLTRLAASVTKIDNASDSVVALLNSISAELLAISGNQSAVEAFAADLNKRADDLATAVATVPVSPPPTP